MCFGSGAPSYKEPDYGPLPELPKSGRKVSRSRGMYRDRAPSLYVNPLEEKAK